MRMNLKCVFVPKSNKSNGFHLRMHECVKKLLVWAPKQYKNKKKMKIKQTRRYMKNGRCVLPNVYHMEVLARRGGTTWGCWVVANDDLCHPSTICRRNKSSGGLRARRERTNKEADSTEKWINQKGKILLLVCLASCPALSHGFSLSASPTSSSLYHCHKFIERRNVLEESLRPHRWNWSNPTPSVCFRAEALLYNKYNFSASTTVIGLHCYIERLGFFGILSSAFTL